MIARYCNYSYTSKQNIFRIIHFLVFANITHLVIYTMAILQTQPTLLCQRTVKSSRTRCFYTSTVLRSTKPSSMQPKAPAIFATSHPDEVPSLFWSYSTLPGFSSSMTLNTQTMEPQKHQSRSSSRQRNTTSNPLNHTAQYHDMKQGHSFSTLPNQPFLEKIFALDLPEGQCVGVRLRLPTMSPSSPYTPSVLHHHLSPLLQWLLTKLHPNEVEYGLALPSDSARHSFFIGRLAIRSAMQLTTSLRDTLQSNHRMYPYWMNNHAVSTMSNHDHRESVGSSPPHSSSITNFSTMDTLKNRVTLLQQVWDQVQLPLVGYSDPSILKDTYGRPQIPHGFLGSISHKASTGVALVTFSNSTLSFPTHHIDTNIRKSVGVDIERTFSRRSSIAKKVLTSNEMRVLGKLENVTKEEEVLLRFRYGYSFLYDRLHFLYFKPSNPFFFSYSLKECIYKAMHPLISQWVGFQEAEVTPHEDGTATVILNLKSRAHERFAEVKAHWRRLDLPLSRFASTTSESGLSSNNLHLSHPLEGDDETGEHQYFLTSSSVTLKHEYSIKHE